MALKDLTHVHQLEVEDAAVIYREYKRQDMNYQKQLQSNLYKCIPLGPESLMNIDRLCGYRAC